MTELSEAVPAVAWPKLRGFARRRGRAPVELALHAAVPLGLTPELLHLIRVNFVDGAHFMAEADVLLSDLVRDLGGGYYELDPAVRELLLRQLRTHPEGDGEERLLRVADFLYGFCRSRLQGLLNAQEREFLQAQQWTALTYVEPAAAAELLAAALTRGVRMGDGGEVRRVAALSHRLAAPLRGVGHKVVRYAARFERVLDGDVAAMTRSARDTAEERTVGKVELPATEEVAGLVADELISATELSVDGQPTVETAEAVDEPSAGDGQEPRSQAAVREGDFEIFISYAHIDNQTLVEGERGWVSQLHSALKIRLAQVLGREVEIWLDRKVHGEDSFDPRLFESLPRGALMVLVLSPRYVRSEWCAAELREFVQAVEAGGGSRDGRLFKVIKTPVPIEDHPEEVQGLLGYEFFEVDSKTGRMRELSSSLDPEGQSHYWVRLDDLVQDIVDSFQVRASASDEVAESGEEPVPPAPPGTVFVSYAMEDRVAADAIKQALEAAGINVFIDRDDLLAGDAFESQLEKEIQECSLFMPLISRHTVQRRQAYFRLEWNLAFERSSRMDLSVPFIVPVAIDDTSPSEPGLPGQLRQLHWLRLPDGRPSSELIETVGSLLRRLRQMLAEADPATEAERVNAEAIGASYSHHQSREATAARKQLDPELQLALFDVIEELCKNPDRFPKRIRSISRDGSVRIYTHPDPPLEITFEVDKHERKIYFMHYTTPVIELRNRVLICYSHQDQQWLPRLRKWLKPLEEDALLDYWDDSSIVSGGDWRQEISQALESAKLAILLVSQNFLTSDFIPLEELAPLLESAENEGVAILWIAVSDSTYEETPLARYQAVNDPSTPLDTFEGGKLSQQLKQIYQRIKERAES